VRKSKRRRRLVLGLVVGGALLAFVLGLVFGFATSGSYCFRVKRNCSSVWIKWDGSIDVEYDIEFENFGRPIDVVDIGLPHPNYRLGTAEAEIILPDGTTHKLSDIRPSTYIEVGVEVHLHEHSIPKGESGRIHFRINVLEMVFPDTADADYASVEFIPTWFAPEFVSGGTHLVVKFHFPVGVRAGEPRYHGVGNAPQEMGYENGRFTYTWVVEDAEQRPYRFGASFPKRGMRRVAESWRYNREWLDGGSRGTSSSGGTGGDFMRYIQLYFYLGMFALVAITTVFSYLRRKRLRRQYIPPRLAVEGVGVRKGLSPAEAAVLLELPAEKIVGIAVLDLVEKGIVRIDSVNPLKVELLKKEEELEPYQKKFVEALVKKGGRDLRQERIKGGFVLLVKSVQRKMAGYSYRETRDYYERMVDALAAGNLRFVCWSLLTDERDLEDAVKERVETQRRRRYPFLVYEDFWWTPFQRRLIYDSDALCKGVLKTTNPSAYAALTSSGRGGGGFGGGCACACAGCACACAGGGR